LDSPLHAAFKLYFSPFPKITFDRYSISLRDGEAPGKMTGISSKFSQEPYIAIKGNRKNYEKAKHDTLEKFFNVRFFPFVQGKNHQDD